MENRTEAIAERLVTQRFSTKNNELVVGGHTVSSLAKKYGTPLFIYDSEQILHQHKTLSSCLDGLASIYYSIKANPNNSVIQFITSLGCGLEVASLGEFTKAIESGCTPENILFAGPGKSYEELHETISEGISEIHCESYEEILSVNEIALAHNKVQDIAIRVNPSEGGIGGAMRMGGIPSQFGVDEEKLDWLIPIIKNKENIRFKGLHFYAGTQILDSKVLVKQWNYYLDVAEKIAEQFGVNMHTIDLGGGLGVPYYPKEKELDLADIATDIAALKQRKANSKHLSGAKLIVEPGRFLVGSSGVYVMSAISVKESRGERFVITNGGMHHHLAGSGNLGQILKRDYPIVKVSELQSDERFQCKVVGPLCTPLDCLGRMTELPNIAIGDLLAVFQSGAYCITASPINFLSHPMPVEIFISEHSIKAFRGFDEVSNDL